MARVDQRWLWICGLCVWIVYMIIDVDVYNTYIFGCWMYCIHTVSTYIRNSAVT
jgi:hypothetical protein